MKYFLAICHDHAVSWSGQVPDHITLDQRELFDFAGREGNMNPDEINEVFVFDNPEIAFTIYRAFEPPLKV